MADSATQTPTSASGLKKNAIGPVGVVFLVLAAASPLIGLTGAVPSAMVLGNGLGVPIAYVLVGLLLALFGVAYVAMSRQVTNAGALYAYVGRGLGIRTGIGAATVALWAYNLVQVAVYGFFGVVMSGQLTEWFGVEIPWYWCTLGLVVLIQIFGWLHIEIGAKVLGVLMAFEWAIMLLMAFAILFTGGADQGFAVDQVFNPSVILAGAPGVALVFAFASMFGFESSALYGEEVRNPKKSIPRATYSALFLITTFFFFTSWMLIVGYGPRTPLTPRARALRVATRRLRLQRRRHLPRQWDADGERLRCSRHVRLNEAFPQRDLALPLHPRPPTEDCPRPWPRPAATAPRTWPP